MTTSTISRRRLLQGGATLLAAPLLAPHFSWAGGSDLSASSLLWITQPNIPASVTYAAHAQRRQVLTLTGRLEHLLYGELVPALQARPVALTGLTDAATLFCIETVASDHGLRMARRALVSAHLRTDPPSPAAGQAQLFSWLMLPRRQIRTFSEVSV